MHSQHHHIPRRSHPSFNTPPRASDIIAHNPLPPQVQPPVIPQSQPVFHSSAAPLAPRRSAVAITQPPQSSAAGVLPMPQSVTVHSSSPLVVPQAQTVRLPRAILSSRSLFSQPVHQNSSAAAGNSHPHGPVHHNNNGL